MREFIEAVRVLGFWRTVYGRTLYRPLMRLTHRFNWHYAPPCYPGGDTLLRCSWCGFSQVVMHRNCIPIDLVIAAGGTGPEAKGGTRQGAGRASRADSFAELFGENMSEKIDPKDPGIDLLWRNGYEAGYEAGKKAGGFTLRWGEPCAGCGRPVHPPMNAYEKGAFCWGDLIYHGDCAPQLMARSFTIPAR